MPRCHNERTGAVADIPDDELPILAPFGWVPVDVPPAAGDDENANHLEAADEAEPDSEKE